MYQLGLGVKQNYNEAAKHFEKSANQKLAQAQSVLASMYYKGLGVKQSFEKAKELYRKACDGGIEQGCKIYKIFNSGNN